MKKETTTKITTTIKTKNMKTVVWKSFVKAVLFKISVKK